ncbi:hypothetical protein B0E54_05728 [Micromonospora sp. MH99]|nr:hypothetical protein [Micromonospora sp. MH99]
MPRPSSTISINAPEAWTRAVTSTTVSGRENAVAFSNSSASMCTSSPTACPTTLTSPTESSRTRWYCSISAAAASSTVPRPTGRFHRRVESVPASTSRLSSLRRIRAARWSSLNRLSSWSGSLSSRSRSSSSSSWRSTSTWLRRARLTNIALTLRRIDACSTATVTALRCTATNASASSPISSSERTTAGATSMLGTPPVTVRSRSSASGSSTCAIRSAWLRSSRIDRATDRPTSNEISRATSRTATTPPTTSRVARNWPLLASSAWRTASSSTPASTWRSSS